MRTSIDLSIFRFHFPTLRVEKTHCPIFRKKAVAALLCFVDRRICNDILDIDNPSLFRNASI